MALNVRNKLGFIDDTIPKPLPTDRDSGSWSRCNDMVATWLINSVSKKICHSLLFMSTAEAIWKNLLSRFKQDDAPRVYEIEQRLSSIQQGSMDVSTYYTELVTLWEEYKNYVELPVCTCGHCECNAAMLWERLQQQSHVTKFLMGLNDAYEQTRRHILMLKPIPTIDEVFNMVSQDERQKNLKHAVPMESPVFQANVVPDAANGFYNGSVENVVYAAQYRPLNKIVCTHCGHIGHTYQKCYKLNGYPPGHKLHNRTGQASASQARNNTQSVNRTSHASQGAQGSQNYYLQTTLANDVTSPAHTLDLSKFSSEQVQSLISQLLLLMLVSL